MKHIYKNENERGLEHVNRHEHGYRSRHGHGHDNGRTWTPTQNIDMDIKIWCHTIKSTLKSALKAYFVIVSP
jgi:hypothetical protein